MPTTYNGIGTHYYGKKNVEPRSGTCQQCGASVELKSYDTRLWFVVVFIPIIPLKRQRIIDYCPSCTRHHAIDLHKWEAAKQVEISGALEKFRANPTPEAAIEAHQTLVNFHQSSQAADFRKVMETKFPNNATIHAYVGAVLTHLGKFDDATASYTRALQLDSDLQEARIGVALGHIRAKRLDEARKLLEILEQPGAAKLYSLAPLEQLAVAYQSDGRHKEALILFNHLQEELPAIGQVKAFRNMIKKSEKALGQKQTILPKKKFSWRTFLGKDRVAQPSPAFAWRNFAVLGGIAAVVFLGFIISNEYIRRHRTLHIVNGLDQPAQIEVLGVGTVQAPPGVTEYILPEGSFRATVTGPIREETDFSIRAEYFNRWFSDPAWVLNIGGAAALVYNEIHYSRNPKPGRAELYFGEKFFQFPRVTHPFSELPETIQIKEHESRTLTQLELFNGEPVSAFHFVESEKGTEEALRFAEWGLRIYPGDKQLLGSYGAAVDRERQSDRAAKYLLAGLTNRPVQIEWHRLYQNLQPNRKHANQLAQQYDAILRSEPTNSALLYLRGRICTDHAEGKTFFERSRDADSSNPYPIFALGYNQMAVADWENAKPLLARAAQLQPDDENFAAFLQSARFALGELAALEQELRNELKAKPLHFYSAKQLCDVLVAQEKTDEAEQVVLTYEKNARTELKSDADEIINLLRRHLLYVTKDFPALEKHAAGDDSMAGRNALFTALIEQGRVAEAVQIFPLSDPDAKDPFHFLTVALAWRNAGNLSEAEKWQDRAIELLQMSDDDSFRAAYLLNRTIEPDQEELNEVVLPTTTKAILLAALSQKFPSAGARLATAARKFNIGLDYPHHLVERICPNSYSAEKSLSDLTSEVNQILSEPDNVARSKRIAPVFQLAEQYAAAGQTNEALDYYTKGIEHQPWNLEAQLAVAQLLHSKGDTKAAQQKAEIVLARAETDILLTRASQISGKLFDAKFPNREPWPENTIALALVPVGKVDAWLMRELRVELQKNLGIPVIIQSLPLDVPEPKRNAVHLKANDLRERFATAAKAPEFQALLRRLNLSTNKLADDEKVFALTEAILKEEVNKELVRNFREELAFLRRAGPQWDSTELVTSMTKTFDAQPGGQRAFLGITTMDLYANESRFVFGIAANGANCGIISYRRYTSALADEPPNRDRLKERTLKQALSSTGLMFGLARCTDPTCARAYANGLAEHDAKQPKLCSQCVEAFAKRFSQ